MVRPQDRMPTRRGAPTERTESYVARREGLQDDRREQRRVRSVELAPGVFTPALDVDTAVGAHDHTGVYSPVGHTHTSGSITDFTEASQDVIGSLLVDSSTIDMTYNDAGNAETVAVIADSSVQKTDVRKNSAGTVFSRRQLNFVEGANITLTVADDSPNNEVDITIAGAAGGSGSVVLVGSAAITAGMTSITLNSIFSATYDNYFFDLRADLGAQTTAGYLIAQLMASGSPLTSPLYYYDAHFTLGGATPAAYAASTQTAWFVEPNPININGVPFHSWGYIESPFKSVATGISFSFGGWTSAGALQTANGWGEYDSTGSVDGIRFTINAGSLRAGGKLSVYGLT